MQQSSVHCAFCLLSLSQQTSLVLPTGWPKCSTVFCTLWILSSVTKPTDITRFVNEATQMQHCLLYTTHFVFCHSANRQWCNPNAALSSIHYAFCLLSPSQQTSCTHTANGVIQMQYCFLYAMHFVFCSWLECWQCSSGKSIAFQMWQVKTGGFVTSHCDRPEQLQLWQVRTVCTVTSCCDRPEQLQMWQVRTVCTMASQNHLSWECERSNLFTLGQNYFMYRVNAE